MAATLDITPDLKLVVMGAPTPEQRAALASARERAQRLEAREFLGGAVVDHYSAAVIRRDDPDAVLTDDLYATPEIVLRDLLADLLLWAEAVGLDYLHAQAEARMQVDGLREGV